MRTLGIRTGKLYQSFGRNSQNSLTKVKVNNDNISAIVGSNLPYANIQNVGGFIKSKGRMHKWFWYQYGKTQNNFFKIMALSVIKRGGVKIKGTKYFDKSIEYYEKELLTPELEYILRVVLNVVGYDIDRAIQIAIDALKDVATELPETFQIALSQNMKFRSANNKFNNPKTVTWVGNE